MWESVGAGGTSTESKRPTRTRVVPPMRQANSPTIPEALRAFTHPGERQSPDFCGNRYDMLALAQYRRNSRELCDPDGGASRMVRVRTPRWCEFW